MTGQQIIDILNFYKCPCSISSTIDNDNYIDFGLIPLQGTTIKKLQTRQQDIALQTGKAAYIILENNKLILRIQKDRRTFYNYFNYLCNLKSAPGSIAIGINPGGQFIQENLFSLPHLLVAGQTGSGKSVFLHSCIISLASRGNVCFRMIDLKRVELSIYNDCGFMVENCITSAEGAKQALLDEVAEMQARYQLMERYKVNHFSLLPNDNLASRVIVIDELADLMLNKDTRRSVENSIIRIAQLGRAAGIHLILATQRPDRNVITGLIKANIPGKVAFTVSNRYDAQVIGIQDAEKLTGKGDCIYSSPGKEPQRLQAFYITQSELIQYTDIIRQNTQVLKQKQAQAQGRKKRYSLYGFIKKLFL